MLLPHSVIGSQTNDPYFKNVSLLLSARDGIIKDYSKNNHAISVVGNTAISSTQAKWGNKSIYFDGNGDYLSIAYNSSQFDWWTNNYTIEAFIFASSYSSWSDVGSPSLPNLVGNISLVNRNNYYSFGISGNKVIFYYFNGLENRVISTSSVNLNQWNHIAMTKSSNGITLFVNGLSQGNVAISGTPLSSSSYNMIIGSYNNTSLNGFTDSLRITKGVARYTSNFTVPTQPFPNW